ncbi:hypothetical protein P43SY_003986 [Pythium insidiosum]|uniref:Myb-like DNA-binding protein n=1 Tax=Pythium insidiosum TaxID=114742 RepID=A0AAD5M3T1_PYTIN|nr:hypothetical protein P43SY_003986 [Pythium insidiosum]
MDLEITTSKPQQAEYRHDFKLPPPLPQPPVALKQENESWRASSGFGLASILNRNSAPTTTTGPPAPPALPTFNLPALHSFGKPLITKPDPSIHKARSILNDPPIPASTMTVEAKAAVPLAETSPPITATKSVQKDTPKKGAPSRRIAPAPADEDENEPEENGSDSIRGGRWSADEHDRFLAGFRIHGHKWKRVQQVVRTRSVTQVRTHAQKYLLKLAKLKAEKKQSDNGTPEMSGAAHSSSDTEGGSNRASSETCSPHKKPRVSAPTDSVDEEYIAAAATTLCFLMRQKIDSLFDSQFDDEKDIEPYDCYSSEAAHEEHSIENSRKRPYMQFITDNSMLHARYDLEFRIIFFLDCIGVFLSQDGVLLTSKVVDFISIS